jgi:hypothetical protein
MKMCCECGEIIGDQMDNLPFKAHFIPDQEWFKMFEPIDRVLAVVAAGRSSTDDAHMAILRTLLSASRHMYQCGKCGRLLVADRHRNMNIYAPTSAEASRTILASHNHAA